MESIKFLCCIVECLNSPWEVWCEANIELKSFFSEYFTSSPGFLYAWIKNFKPTSVRGISLHPLNLLALFQILSPCLRKTTEWVLKLGVWWFFLQKWVPLIANFFMWQLIKYTIRYYSNLQLNYQTFRSFSGLIN